MTLDRKTTAGGILLDDTWVREIRARLKDGRLPCAAAFAAARFLRVDAQEIGRAADHLRIRLSHCQLGLFGFSGRAKGWPSDGFAGRPVPAGFEDAVLAARESGGSIGCAVLWEAAERFAVSRIQAGYVAESLGISIRHCRLGAF
jgi:hypothetical protein